jgi:hypothetical protein
MNIFEFWNESSGFPLFLMGKFTLICALDYAHVSGTNMLANQGTTVYTIYIYIYYTGKVAKIGYDWITSVTGCCVTSGNLCSSFILL